MSPDSTTLSLRQLLSALRHTPRGRRLSLVRALTPFLFRSPPKRATSAICEFPSLAEYPSSYARLAELLGRPEQRPVQGEMEFLRRMQDRRAHSSGTVGVPDYFFLTALASILAPRRALEIGTSSGFSSAIIAAALHRRHPEVTGTLVDTIDLHPQYFADPNKAVGFEIPDIVPALREAVRVHIPRASDFVPELLAPRELAFAFIDADHQHPWPLLDALRVAPYLQDGGWLVLHDIQLGTIGVAAADKGEPVPFGAPFGAEWLFKRWPFPKISGGNIGAVQSPPDKTALLPLALELSDLPFEMSPTAHRKMRKALFRSLVDLADAARK